MKTPEMPELQFEQKSTDYYRKWYVTIGADDAITIHANSLSITLSAQGWIDSARGVFPESIHIKAFMNAICYYHPPNEALKIQKKYLQLLNQRDEPNENT